MSEFPMGFVPDTGCIGFAKKHDIDEGEVRKKFGVWCRSKNIKSDNFSQLYYVFLRNELKYRQKNTSQKKSPSSSQSYPTRDHQERVKLAQDSAMGPDMLRTSGLDTRSYQKKHVQEIVQLPPKYVNIKEPILHNDAKNLETNGHGHPIWPEDMMKFSYSCEVYWYKDLSNKLTSEDKEPKHLRWWKIRAQYLLTVPNDKIHTLGKEDFYDRQKLAALFIPRFDKEYKVTMNVLGAVTPD